MIKETIGCATLYLGESLEILPTIQADCLVCDPPYGIGESAGKNASRGNLAIAQDFGSKTWDLQIEQHAVNMALNRVGDAAIFGGNYYVLPPSPCWLVWDKVNGKNDFADCELVWTNLKGAARLKKYMWHGMLKEAGETRGDHPTQKPVGIMEWVISFITGQIVLDPFMGSGTTGIACANMGRDFIGIEREPEYFYIACRRLDEAQRQQRLFA